MSSLTPRVTQENFFAKIVPGAIFLAPFVTGVEFAQPDQFNILDLNFILLFLLTSLVVGELFDLASSSIPLRFRRVLYTDMSSRGRDESANQFLGLQDRIRRWVHRSNYTDNPIGTIPRYIVSNPDTWDYESIFSEHDSSFQAQFEREFGVDISKVSTKEVYELLLTKMDRIGSNRLSIYETRFKMAINIRNAVIFALILSIAALIQSSEGIFTHIFGAAFLAIMVYSYVGVYVSQTASKEFVRKLFIEFYHNREV